MSDTHDCVTLEDGTTLKVSLVAAAPDLLKALKAMVEPGMQPKHLTKAQWEHLPWIVAARAAIAKAEGREV